MVGRDGTGGRRAAPAPPGPNSLAPPWTPVATAVAIGVTVVVTGLVWHSTRLPGLDAWVLHLLGAHSGERQFWLATGVATGLRALTLSGIVATALVSWMVLRRWNAVALAVLAPVATLAVDKLLKPLVARRAPGSTVFHYPSGHVAVATALALSLVLILWPTMTRPRGKALVGLSAALLVSLMAWAPPCCSIAGQSGADSSSSMPRTRSPTAPRTRRDPAIAAAGEPHQPKQPPSPGRGLRRTR